MNFKIKKTAILLLCLLCLFPLAGCEDDWQKGERGEIVYTENDQDPNMFGECVTEEQAKELGFDKKIYIYVPNDDFTDIIEKVSYTKKEWFDTEYIAKIQSAFLDSDLLDADISIEGYAKVNFHNANAVQRYCRYSKPTLNENGTNKEQEFLILETYQNTITRNVIGISNVLFFIEGSPYNTSNIETDDGNVFA